jgi:hypothetical protein
MLNTNRFPVAAMLAGLLVLSACASTEGESVDTTATTTTTAEQPATTAGPTAPPTTGVAKEERTVSDTVEPAGSVEGGSVQRAYLADQYPPELTGLIDRMIGDLAERLGTDESAVTIVATEEVVWSDSSLGCPQPDMSYAQVVTDGMRVILEANGNFYDYRSGGTGDPILCVQAPVTDKSTAGVYELTEEGVVQVEPPEYNEKAPGESLNPPDE